MSVQLRIGARVELQNLERTPELNGRIGEVVKFVESKGRWSVRLDTNGKSFNLLPHNVVAVAADHMIEEPVETVQPWRIDQTISQQTQSKQQRCTTDEERTVEPGAGWGHDLFDRLAASQNTTLSQVWMRWARKADALADSQIREAFRAGLADHLHEAASRAPKGELGVVLAQCGSDCADHEASMRHVQRLIREDLPSSCVAQVGPEDFNFKTLAGVTRRVCEQLMQQNSPGTGAPRDVAGDLGEAEVDDEWWPEDDDAEQTWRGAGMMGFVDWHREHQEQGRKAGLVVLLVERAEAVPNHLLIDLLRQFGRACCGNGIRTIAVLGLQQPPQSRFELLERDPLIRLIFRDGLRMFDSLGVCNRLLESIAEDPLSLPVSPTLLQWLRNQFLYTRRSVTGTLRALALLCQEHLSQRELASVGCLAGCPDEAMISASTVQLKRHFEQRLQNASPDLVDRLRVSWAEITDLIDDKDSLSDYIKDHAASVAADVAIWHRRFCVSLPVWDVLLCAAQPIARHESRLKRIGALANLLWPKLGSAGDSRDEGKCLEEETENIDELVQRRIQSTLKLVFEDGTEADRSSKLVVLHAELLKASVGLDGSLSGDLQELANRNLDEGALREGVSTWLDRVRLHCWRPLSGFAHSFFLEIAAGETLQDRIERRLSGTKGLTFEATLGPLSIGRRSSVEAPAEDITLLWRLLQGAMGRRVEITELWRVFAQQGDFGGAIGTARRRRFGLALAALHVLGLHVPRAAAGGGCPNGKEAGGWRSHKRYFGRIWRGSKAKFAEPWMPPLVEAGAPGWAATAGLQQSDAADGAGVEAASSPGGLVDGAAVRAVAAADSTAHLQVIAHLVELEAEVVGKPVFSAEAGGLVAGKAGGSDEVQSEEKAPEDLHGQLMRDVLRARDECVHSVALAS
eukprot:CAMPEP_0177169888 /NCGR_PEP_ID=MMETSP0367-20130122/9808_1 /TAXON_ID=447022 ORGANISM="Scrippsiella hangoei-like, Strain SHHI-4" /NCGR_SAMPLE_ID=MMETSP0367 /ASSEMBLY_ACC=CAM_ASM_000362 /LENGTH=912 /DNA_ID=CAMNT_0018616055 /DNA_START=10 /DNA_END=2747 /DNA_ORIENTATION=-